MVFVAVLLLPLIAVLLLVMDRIEEHVLDPAAMRGRHAGHRRHLRLVPGGRRSTDGDSAPAGTEPDEAARDERPRAA